MSELRWRLMTFSGKVKTRTGYVLARCVARCGIKSVWEPIMIEDTKETLVFDQYPLGQAVPKIMDISELADVEEKEAGLIAIHQIVGVIEPRFIIE